MGEIAVLGIVAVFAFATVLASALCGLAFAIVADRFGRRIGWAAFTLTFACVTGLAITVASGIGVVSTRDATSNLAVLLIAVALFCAAQAAEALAAGPKTSARL